MRSGDNPWSIARRFNIPLEDLLAWNNLDTDAVLNVGQAIALREPAAGAATARSARSGRTYEVRKGDNLWQISRKFDASVEELRRLNGFGAGHDLQPGDRVILRNGCWRARGDKAASRASSGGKAAFRVLPGSSGTAVLCR